MHEISLPRPHRAASFWRRAARAALAAAALLVSPALALAQSLREPEGAALLDHPDPGVGARADALQAGARHPRQEQRQEDRVLHADLVLVGGRGAARQVGRRRGARARVVPDRQDPGRQHRRLRHLLQAEGRHPGSRPRLQVDPDHQEGLEVHHGRLGQGLGDAAGRPGQHLRLADPRVDLRRQGREDAAEAVLHQGRVLRRPRPLDPRRASTARPTPPSSPRTAS